MAKEKIIGISVIVFCVAVIGLISHKVFIEEKSSSYDDTISSEPDITPNKSPELVVNGTPEDETERTTAVLPVSPVAVPSSTVSSPISVTTTDPTQTSPEQKALEFWEAEYSRMKIMNINDFIIYMSQDDPTTAEIFQYTTPDENDSLYKNFQKNFKNIASIIEDPDVNLTVEQDDVSDSRPLVFLKYSTPSSNLTVALSTTYGSQIDNILGITLNGQESFLLDEQLWSEISSKSYDRYFKTLDY